MKIGVVGIGAVGAYKVLKKLFGKKSDAPAAEAAAATPSKKTVRKTAKGRLIGYTLVPNEGEDLKSYEERLKSLQDAENMFRRPKTLKSIYTDEGLESYKAAKSMGASMAGSEYDPSTDPVLKIVEANKALPQKESTGEQAATATAEPAKKMGLLDRMQSWWNKTPLKKGIDAIGSAKEKVKDLASGLWDKAKSAGSKLKDGAFGLFSSAKDKVSGLWSKAKSAITAGRERIASMRDKAFSGLSTGANIMTGGLSSLFSDSGKDTVGLNRLGSILTPDVSKTDRFASNMKTLDTQAKVSEDEAGASTGAISDISDEATRQQTEMLVTKLDEIIQSIYGVRDATVEAGEGTSNRINNARNEAIAQSATYANDAISRNKPKPREPGLKPPAIDVKRPILV